MWIHVVVRPLAIKIKVNIIRDGQFCNKGEGARGNPVQKKKLVAALRAILSPKTIMIIIMVIIIIIIGVLGSRRQ